MKNSIVVFFFLFLAPVISNGCALCAMQTPVAHASLYFDLDKKRLNNIHIKWTFAPSFTSTLYYAYDLNSNKKFEKNEMDDIENTLIDYLSKKDYLIKLSFYDGDSESRRLGVEPKNIKFQILDKQIIFEFDLPQDMVLKNKRVLKVHFADDEGYFLFKINKIDLKAQSGFKMESNININTGFFTFLEDKSFEAKQSLDKHSKNGIKINNVKDASNENSVFYGIAEKKLLYFQEKIKTLFRSSKESFSSFFVLMFFSFAYGVFHAAIPRHGKMLVGSYFLANDKSYLKAFLLCLKIGFVHVSGAFLLVMLSVYFIKTFISKLVYDIAYFTTIISSFIILLLAFYLIYKKINHKKTCSCCSCHKHHDNSHEEWSLALAAGLVPCPGTVAIFVLAFTFGNYLSGFLCAISLAFGMSIVIFCVGVFGKMIREKTSHSFSNFLGIIEYLGLVLLVVLGVFMLFSVLKFGA